jgi:hypothetical protein
MILQTYDIIALELDYTLAFVEIGQVTGESEN